jgi:hypothetical protein
MSRNHKLLHLQQMFIISNIILNQTELLNVKFKQAGILIHFQC